MFKRLPLWFALVGGSCAQPGAIDAGPPPRVQPAPAERLEDDLPSHTALTGSAACRDCHVERYDAWRSSWHARALATPTRATVVGRFDGQHFKGASSEAWMHQRGSMYLMSTASRQGTREEYPVAWVVGGKHMQDALTEFPDGRLQVLPVYFHVTGGGAWVDYNEKKQGVVGPDHPFFWTNFRRTANHECLSCHSTGLAVGYDVRDHRWTTTMAEPGVGCEACHGPGARHAETKAKGDIVSLGSLPRDAAVAVCASCHGPREPVFPFLDARHGFTPGDDYAAHFQAAGLVDGAARSGDFFADGRPNSSSFEWQALQQSKCFLKGGLSCLTCHGGPHGAGTVDELKQAPDAPCRRCHASVQPQAHSHHASREAQACVACHMPKVVSGVLDAFADHSLDLPLPQNTVKHGIPSACGLCHPKLGAAALAAAEERWWPDPARRARRLRLADAFDEQTKAGSQPMLEEIVADEAEAPLLRGTAAELLGQRFGASAGPRLVPLLGASDDALRARSFSALSAAGAKDAAGVIRAHLTDRSVLVRELAAMLLTNWGDPKGRAALQALATAPETKGLVRPHLLLAQRSAIEHDLEAAQAEVTAALDATPYLTPALVLGADLAVVRGDPRRARELLEEALRFDPQLKSAQARLLALGGGGDVGQRK